LLGYSEIQKKLGSYIDYDKLRRDVIGLKIRCINNIDKLHRSERDPLERETTSLFQVVEQ
jgi:hypothetical protein